MFTERLHLRLPVQADRDRFVELFYDEHFMVFVGATTTAVEANERFDTMLANAAVVPYAKQPIIERDSGKIVGYSGVAFYEIDGERVPEYGYRLCIEARGKGYATEAGLAIVDLARQSFSGTIYAMIDPTNQPSMRVADKLGFTFWKLALIDGDATNLYRIEL